MLQKGTELMQNKFSYMSVCASFFRRGSHQLHCNRNDNDRWPLVMSVRRTKNLDGHNFESNIYLFFIFLTFIG